jgi:hypothetical protein
MVGFLCSVGRWRLMEERDEGRSEKVQDDSQVGLDLADSTRDLIPEIPIISCAVIGWSSQLSCLQWEVV